MTTRRSSAKMGGGSLAGLGWRLLLFVVVLDGACAFSGSSCPDGFFGDFCQYSYAPQVLGYGEFPEYISLVSLESDVAFYSLPIPAGRSVRLSHPIVWDGSVSLPTKIGYRCWDTTCPLGSESFVSYDPQLSFAFETGIDPWNTLISQFPYYSCGCQDSMAGGFDIIVMFGIVGGGAAFSVDLAVETTLWCVNGAYALTPLYYLSDYSPRAGDCVCEPDYWNGASQCGYAISACCAMSAFVVLEGTSQTTVYVDSTDPVLVRASIALPVSSANVLSVSTSHTCDDSTYVAVSLYPQCGRCDGGYISDWGLTRTVGTAVAYMPSTITNGVGATTLTLLGAFADVYTYACLAEAPCTLDSFYLFFFVSGASPVVGCPVTVTIASDEFYCYYCPENVGTCTGFNECTCLSTDSRGPFCTLVEGWWEYYDDTVPQHRGLELRTTTNEAVSRSSSPLLELTNFVPTTVRAEAMTSFHTYLYISPSNTEVELAVRVSSYEGDTIEIDDTYANGYTAIDPSYYEYRVVVIGEFVDAVNESGTNPQDIPSVLMSWTLTTDTMTWPSVPLLVMGVDTLSMSAEVVEAVLTVSENEALSSTYAGGVNLNTGTVGARVGNWFYGRSSWFADGGANPPFSYTFEKPVETTSILRLSIGVERRFPLSMNNNLLLSTATPALPLYISASITDSLGNFANIAALIGIALVLIGYCLGCCCYPAAAKRFVVERLTWLHVNGDGKIVTRQQLEKEGQEGSEKNSSDDVENSLSASHDGGATKSGDLSTHDPSASHSGESDDMSRGSRRSTGSRNSSSRRGSGSEPVTTSDSDGESVSSTQTTQSESAAETVKGQSGPKRESLKDKVRNKIQGQAEGKAEAAAEDHFEEEEPEQGKEGGVADKAAALSAKKGVPVPASILDWLFVLVVELVALAISIIRSFFNLAMLHQSFKLYYELPSITLLEVELPTLSWLFLVSDYFEKINFLSSGAAAWNCGGALQIATPLFVLVCVTIIGIIFAFDLLLVAAIGIGRIKKRGGIFKSRAGTILFAGLRSFAVAFLFYILQMVIVTVSSVVFAVTGVRRTCSTLDYSIQFFAQILNIIIVVFASVFFLLMFAGKPTRRRIHMIPVIGVLFFFIDACYRIVLTSLGVWTAATTYAHDIPGKAATFDDDDEDDDNKHEATMEIVGRTRGIVWLVIPAAFVMAKAAEAFNSPAVMVFTKTVSLNTPFRVRVFKFINNVLVLSAVLATALAPTVTAVFVMLAAHLPLFVGNVLLQTVGEGWVAAWKAKERAALVSKVAS